MWQISLALAVGIILWQSEMFVLVKSDLWVLVKYKELDRPFFL